MKTVYECDTCGAVSRNKAKIKQCPVCKMDVCPHCNSKVACCETRKLGHKECFIMESAEYYEPKTHAKKACKICGLVYCDCK